MWFLCRVGVGWGFSGSILPQNLSTYLTIIFSMNKSLKDENWRYRKPLYFIKYNEKHKAKSITSYTNLKIKL